MDNNIIAIIATIILCLAIGVVGIIKLYKIYKKNNKKFNLTEFVDNYGDAIIDALKDVILLIKESKTEYESKAQYETVIISTTIELIKKNYKKMGIDISLLSLIDTPTLTSIIYNILNGNAIDIFGVLDDSYIMENKHLYSGDVLTAYCLLN